MVNEITQWYKRKREVLIFLKLISIRRMILLVGSIYYKLCPLRGLNRVRYNGLKLVWCPPKPPFLLMGAIQRNSRLKKVLFKVALYPIFFLFLSWKDCMWR